MAEGKEDFSHLPERLNGLAELAENLWWSWHPAARMVFKLLDRREWKASNHNPDKMLKQLSREVLEKAEKDKYYLSHYDIVMSEFRSAMSNCRCDILDYDQPQSTPIAYFSAEFGLHHSLPFYAGGLGFLAGDFIKECSDLRVPMVAMGFMYPGGYLHQLIREDGWQENVAQVLDRDAAPISRVFDDQGRHLIVRVPLIEPPIHVAVWKVTVGHVPLYLMDTDIEINDPWNRLISARLYTGDLEQRLRQEIVLGVGGSEVLEKMGIAHSVLHLNEGHAAFALLERIRDRILAGLSFEEGAKQISSTTVFTTHTPVKAGHDIFPFQLMEKYFNSFWPALKLDHDEFLQLGIHPEEPHAGFNMTAFALRMAGFRNAVSLKHGEVARRMWQSLWPDKSEHEVPIDSVTNGIHIPTWIEPKMELLFNKHLGNSWLADHDNPLIWELVDEIPDNELWNTHYWLKMKLINALREKSRRKWKNDHPSSTPASGVFLDPDVLTIGFARRFATYKRADLIFQDMERLKNLLNHSRTPVQFIFAGKAHPADDPGKRILQKIVQLARDPETAGRIAFVENYNEQYGQYLVHGVDIWLNNPIPPKEASGTSGMKAALNGVPHFSIADGWWCEGYNGKNGWTFGENISNEDRDEADARAIYDLLEKEIIPLYYNFNNHGFPRGWVKIMKESIKSTGSKFSARRMVKEYSEKYYSKALKNAEAFES
ncbi:MAG: glycosyltransferase family 1 protein [Desulfobacteraceae bacterium]|nr:glycosyltransferase family 1 protein [Desulfobacteraceae bacterium]MBU4054504.1 alpha-glucan family phosphorylase [Pseudomonadota bacterium]